MPAMHKRAGGICLLILLLCMPVFAASAQTVVRPTSAEHAQRQAHAQQLKSQKQARELNRQQQKRVQDTARKAYKSQPRLQDRMKHASDARQRQSRQRDKDLDRHIRHAEKPQPTRVTPAPAGSNPA